MKQEKRFVILQKESVSLGREAVVLMDRETGVLYLSFQSGYGGGITPLLDRDGKPAVSSRMY